MRYGLSTLYAVPAILSVPISLDTYHLSSALVSYKITIKGLKGIFCLISCSSRHHLTDCGFSCFSGDHSFGREHDNSLIFSPDGSDTVEDYFGGGFIFFFSLSDVLARVT